MNATAVCLALLLATPTWALVQLDRWTAIRNLSSHRQSG
jgi:hypothetical protein